MYRRGLGTINKEEYTKEGLGAINKEEDTTNLMLCPYENFSQAMIVLYHLVRSTS